MTRPPLVAEVLYEAERTPRQVRIPILGSSVATATDPRPNETTIEIVIRALARLGYRPMGGAPIVRHNGVGSIVVEPVPGETPDWTQVPTLVRIDDLAATNLNNAAAALGLPADDLASVWISYSAHAALHRRRRFLDDLADHSRITGWTPDGTPLLKEA